jgi:CheY-like chemotaxis protein
MNDQRSMGASMDKTVICPYCHLPQQFTPKPSDPPGETYCPNCGGPMRWGPQAAVRPPTVLWIDDDRLLLGACVPVLERHGYRVLVAHDGATGIATAKRERPDAILLDVVMPTINGLEVCQQLRADPHLQATPIILLTALEDVKVGRKGKKAGATTTLRKPSSPEFIVEFLDKVVGRKGDRPRL